MFTVGELLRQDGSKLKIGDRVESDGHIATVKFIGHVPPTEGTLWQCIVLGQIFTWTGLNYVEAGIVLFYSIHMYVHMAVYTDFPVEWNCL